MSMSKEKLQTLLDHVMETSKKYHTVIERQSLMLSQFWNEIGYKEERIQDQRQQIMDLEYELDELKKDHHELKLAVKKKHEKEKAQFDKDLTELISPTRVNN